MLSHVQKRTCDNACKHANDITCQRIAFPLVAHEYEATHSSNLKVELSDDTIMVGLLADSDEPADRQEVVTLEALFSRRPPLSQRQQDKQRILDSRRLRERERDPIHLS